MIFFHEFLTTIIFSLTSIALILGYTTEEIVDGDNMFVDGGIRKMILNMKKESPFFFHKTNK